MNELAIFIRGSGNIGQRLDLVQGAGGNTSVKLDDQIMAIKSSGSLLSEMSLKKGYVRVDRSILEPLLDQAAQLDDPVESENYLHSNLFKAVVDKTNEKPSMEAVMHIFLPKYVVHSHSVYANVLNCMVEGPSILKKMFGDDILIVAYATPGFELALKIRRLTKKVKRPSYTIFLLNHGVIVADQSPKKAYNRMIEINQTCKQYLKKRLPRWPEFHDAKATITAYLNKYSKPNQIVKKCCFPDAVVFCSKPEKLSDQTKPIFDAMIYILATIEALDGTFKPLNGKQQKTLLKLDSEQYRISAKR